MKGKEEEGGGMEERRGIKEGWRKERKEGTKKEGGWRVEGRKELGEGGGGGQGMNQ